MAKITFLEAFNAKQMRTVDIVGSFVPTPQFNQLAGAWHALLIGPRGSGKTTYLKMLELKALRAWQHAEADNYREGINFSGIFVPSDIAWGAMVEALGGGRLKTDCFDVIACTAFNTSVFQATISAIEDRVNISNDSVYMSYRSTEISTENLEAILADIASAWKLSITTLSFSGIRNSLGRRLLEIKAKALEISANPQHTLLDVYNKIEYATLDLNEALNYALSRVDEVINDRDGKWALLLDEFEIAPESLQKLILANLRSSNTKLIYKIALAPCGPHTEASLTNLAPPSSGNDYRQIELWYKDKNSVMNFCNLLFASRMSHFEHFSGKSPDEVFGSTLYSDTDNQSREDDLSHWKERWAIEFAELRDKDESFRNYLFSKGIDPYNLDSSSSLNRKIAPLVAFRNAHRGTEGGSRKGRKKLLFAYTGWEAIATISEGNPRWLIGMLNLIASRHTNDTNLPVSQSIQHNEIEATTEAFSAMLQTVATAHAIGISTSTPIYKLLATIGSYFNKRIVKQPFIEEPPMSFVVDNLIDHDTENALRIAFNHGAIVCMTESDEIGGYTSLKGKRFRLAYLLAPKFNLPLRSTKSIVLSTVLASDQTDAVVDYKSPNSQGKLFL